MARPTVIREPEDIRVQVNVLIPHWRRMELLDLKNQLGVTMSDLILDAVDRVHPPKRQYRE